MPSDLSEVIRKDFTVTTAHTFYMRQVAAIADLENRMNVKKSAIVRDAIDCFYKIQNDPRITRVSEVTGLDKSTLLEQAIALLDAKYKVQE